jgi:hypothetical protein
MNGDQDGYSTIDEFVQCAKYIHNVEVALIPGAIMLFSFAIFPPSGHRCNPSFINKFTQRRKGRNAKRQRLREPSWLVPRWLDIFDHFD